MSPLPLLLKNKMLFQRKYTTRVTCFNCSHQQSIKIPKGRLVKEYLKSNEAICANCGCSAFTKKQEEGKKIRTSSVNPKLRFEVFKRDNFTCQYCGEKPPEVTLEVDHLIPVSKGGTDDQKNLITSCIECNRGKSNEEVIK